MASQAIISSTVLKWARLRSNFNLEQVAKKINVKIDKIEKWENGDSRPTFKQAQKLANVFNIPFGYLFLDEPPKEKQLLPDLRTITNYPLDNFSVDLYDVISNVKYKQNWYKDYKIERGDIEIPYVGKYHYDDDSKVIADEITKTLQLTIEDRINCRNWEEFYKLLVERAENIGFWVMQSSMVKNNTHRILDVEEFRGFVISDSIAPVIFINGSDSKSARIFTLIHEIVHLWFNSSGVLNFNFRNDKMSDYNAHEEKCNEIAAEILVPEIQIKEKWDIGLSVEQNSEILSKYFKVSRVVIARRAFDLKFINKYEFFNYYDCLTEIWKLNREKQKDKKGGPSFYKTVALKNGNAYSYDVVQNVYSQNILMRDGARLLDLTPATLSKFSNILKLS
ncbi:MAG: ImmA/IrrE family metallo-endopeptidase [Sphaerochaetaceae bacterium]|nr:ImmA/IrrE family metallo-endopeptidase [Sphaerochaetaceae bacterium]